ncbi:hypothetical protein [Lysobacter terrae]
MSTRSLVAGGVLVLAAAIGLSLLAAGRVPDFLLGVLYGTGGSLLLAALLRWRLPAPCDTTTPALRRRYLRELMPAMVLYVVTILLSVWLLKRVDGVVLRTVIALLPVPPVALAVRAMVRYVRDADELQRRIEVEALAFAAAWVSVAYLAAGLLQVAKVIAVPAGAAMIWVLPMLCLVYVVAKVVVSRRYS